MGASTRPFQLSAPMETIHQNRGINAQLCLLHRGSQWLHQFRKSGKPKFLLIKLIKFIIYLFIILHGEYI